MFLRVRCILAGVVLWGLAAGACGTPAIHAENARAAPDFKADVLPIFEAKCIRCHGAKRRAGKLDMRTLEALLAGGESGPALKPGNAQKSLLIELIHFKEMPPKKEEPRVTKEELDLLRAWIDGMSK